MVWLLVVHVVTAMVYVGGHLIENWLLYQPQALGGRAQVLRAIRAGEPLINVAAPLMILSGLAMVVFGDSWSFKSPFVLIGLGAIATSTIIGIPMLKEMKALETLMEQQQENDELLRRYDRLSAAWSSLGAVYLVAVWAMVFKP